MQIRHNHFYGKFPDGIIISMPLNLSLDDVNDITEGDVSASTSSPASSKKSPARTTQRNSSPNPHHP